MTRVSATVLFTRFNITSQVRIEKTTDELNDVESAIRVVARQELQFDT